VERYQIILAYDGTDFVGSQRQATSRTVQSVVEKALRQVGWTGRSIILAGRTDTGVHAAGQVAAVDMEWKHSTEDLLQALNANLPPDVAVRAVRTAPKAFHPRFDAISRRYRYKLYIQSSRDPLRDRHAWRVWPQVDGGALTKAARALVGCHDFAPFGAPPRPGASTVRTIMQSAWSEHGDEWIFDVQADAFLYHMVRRLVYVQVAIGKGRLRAEAIREAFECGTRLSVGLAPASGLTLLEVEYPPF
jgi:tRNA pseudouridine38-40 synthase